MKERTGSIHKRNGVIIVRVRYTDRLGKRRELVRQAGSKPEARDIRKQLLAEVARKKSEADIDTAKMTFTQLAEMFKSKRLIPAEFENGKKARGLKSLKSPLIWYARLVKHFGKAIIHVVTADDVEDYKSKRLATGLSIASVNRELSLLCQIFNFAKTRKYITVTPFESADDPIIRLSLEIKRDRVMTQDEEIRLLEKCGKGREHIRAMLITAVDTGLRKGEMLKLQVSDVDLKSGVITVRAETSKTGTERFVPVTPRLRLEIEPFLTGKKSAERVFVITGFDDTWRRLLRNSKITNLRWHDLRHTAITRWIESGISHTEAMKISGHTQMNTFLRYLNLQPKRLQQIANTLAEYQLEQALEGKGEFSDIAGDYVQ
ncbi:MAG: site-specific integrase [Acidobacteria bacterium]|nr:site-specific integrase [Acidobacteriota bacterium]